MFDGRLTVSGRVLCPDGTTEVHNAFVQAVRSKKLGLQVIDERGNAIANETDLKKRCTTDRNGKYNFHVLCPKQEIGFWISGEVANKRLWESVSLKRLVLGENLIAPHAPNGYHTYDA